MNKNTIVKVKRENLPQSLAAVLPDSIFWNTARVIRANDDNSRYQVMVLGERYWFDAEAVEKAK